MTLYTVFAVAWPVTNQYSYECEYEQQSCELGPSSPFYTKNLYVYDDTLVKTFHDNTTQELGFRLHVVPNTHLCAVYCYQGDVADAERQKHYNKASYATIVTQARTQTANALGTVSAYIIAVLISVGILTAACLSV